MKPSAPSFAAPGKVSMLSPPRRLQTSPSLPCPRIGQARGQFRGPSPSTIRKPSLNSPTVPLFLSAFHDTVLQSQRDCATQPQKIQRFVQSPNCRQRSPSPQCSLVPATRTRSSLLIPQGSPPPKCV